MKLVFENKKRMNENLSSLNDFLDELKNGCGTKKEADALYRKAKETLGKGDFGLFVKEYSQARNMLSESKKRMGEGFESRHDASNKLFDICNELYEVLEDYQSELAEANVYNKIKEATDNIFDSTELFSPGRLF